MEKMMEVSQPFSDAESRLLVGYMEDIADKEEQYNILMMELREAQTAKNELMGAQQELYDTVMSELRETQIKKTELEGTEEQRYNALMVQLREIQIKKTTMERMDPSKMYLTEKLVTPRTPEEPIRPRKLINILVTAVLSLIVGLGVAFSLEYFEKSE